MQVGWEFDMSINGATAIGQVLVWLCSKRPVTCIRAIPVWEIQVGYMLIVLNIYEHSDPESKVVIGYSLHSDGWPIDPDFVDGY